MLPLVYKTILILLFAGPIFAESWTDRLSIGGDFRYRHETIEDQLKDSRNRHRLRLRLNIEASVSSNTDIGLQLASGSDDPTSSNQTFDDGFSSKDILLDRAFFRFKPSQLPGLTIVGGKFNNPLFRPGNSELVWNSVLNPEGLSATYSRKYEKVSVTATGAGFWVEERPQAENSWIAAGQLILSLQPCQECLTLFAGGGYYDFENTIGFEPFYDPTRSLGNSIDDDGNYTNEYNLAEFFAGADYAVRDIPVAASVDFVSNSAIDSDNHGWQATASAGKTKKPGDIFAKYTYRTTDRDAVLGVFSDATFGGGATDSKGHELTASVKFDKNSIFRIVYFANQADLSTGKHNYHRLQLDLMFTF